MVAKEPLAIASRPRETPSSRPVDVSVLRFTPRQAQIVRLVALGLGDKEIAVRLGLAPNTVRTHLQRLFREYGLHNRAEAAAKWVALTDTPRDETDERASPGRRRHPRWTSLVLPIAALMAIGLAILAIPSRIPQTGIHTLAASRAGMRSYPSIGLPPSVAGATDVSWVRSSSGGQPQARVQLAPAELDLINQDRSRAGLTPLAWDQCLASLAAEAARWMAQQANPTAITARTSPVACGLGQARLFENVGYWSSVDDARLNGIFLADVAHRANILGQFRRVGAGWAMAPSGVDYLVVEFG